MTNAFGLVYHNAIERNETGKVNIQTIEYEAKGLPIPEYVDQAVSKLNSFFHTYLNKEDA